MNNTSDVLAAIAIVVSLGSAAYQWYLDSRINKINLEADYFKTLYSQHLLYELPKARAYMRFSNGRLKDIDALIGELNKIRQDSLYFMYADKDFYTDIKIALGNLEDYLVKMGEESLNEEEQTEVFEQVQRKLEDIYKIFNDKFVGN